MRDTIQDKRAFRQKPIIIKEVERNVLLSSTQEK